MNSPHPHENLKPLLNKGDIAKRMRVAKKTVERWIASGVIPPADVQATKLTRLWTPETLNQRFKGVF